MKISFVMINSKSGLDFENYTETLIADIKKVYSCDKADFYTTNEQIRKCILNINDKDYFLDFTHLVTNDTLQLKIDLSPRVEINDLDKDLHDLKIRIKDLIIDDWERCVWLEDGQSASFAENLYGRVHNIENSMRRLINKILFYRLGGAWWESYIPSKLQNKYNHRNGAYEAKAPSFKKVHTNLLSMDTDDLLSILELKTYKIKKKTFLGNPDPLLHGFAETEHHIKHQQDINLFKQLMNNIMYDEKNESHQKKLTKLLKEQVEVDQDFWEKYFSPVFSCSLREFKGYWKNFYDDRNHVAHNKLIDYKLYRKYTQTIERIEAIIKDAESSFDNILEKDSSVFLAQLKENEEATQILNNHQELIEEESGVRIRNYDDIREEFLLAIDDTFESLKGDFYSRLDLEVVYTEPELNDEIETIFEITNNISNKSLTVEVESGIDDSPGYRSELTLKVYFNDELKETFEAYYQNGEARFDEEQSNYMPEIYDEFDLQGVISSYDFISSLLEVEMPEVPEEDLASFSCGDCNEYAVNLSEENEYKVGICLYCGHLNEVGGCLRCDSFIDNTVDSLCDSCQEYVDKQ
ncbi:hypothetical protein [Peribacillus butanolivorans]|uniref:hypothetical protein n=1 Tax=Peribacillus butanolivorans TaxID=421767 RepID=UPI003670D945